MYFGTEDGRIGLDCVWHNIPLLFRYHAANGALEAEGVKLTTVSLEREQYRLLQSAFLNYFQRGQAIVGVV